MLVTNVSYGGCRFEASVSHDLQLGDHVKVAFSLDDAEGSMIKKEAIVRNITGAHIRCEFILLPDRHDGDLSCYLRNP